MRLSIQALTVLTMGQLYKGWGSFAWNGTAKNVVNTKGQDEDS